MGLSLAETQAVNDIAKLLYSFLPGSSFLQVAQELHLQHLWSGGSKLPAITMLLEKTLETRRELFCKLVVEIVRKGTQYRNKSKPISREEIVTLNSFITRVHFKIPELWDEDFLNSLPSTKKNEDLPTADVNRHTFDNLKQELIKLTSLTPQARGFAFEKILQDLFVLFDLDPRSPFRLTGEQIDGSFQIASDTYLVEAKWQEKMTPLSDLLFFREKVESKSTWSRGLFISYSGFTPDGLEAFSRGRSTNIIGMTSEDMYFVLDGRISLTDAINRKARRAAETGEFFTRVYDLI